MSARSTVRILRSRERHLVGLDGAVQAFVKIDHTDFRSPFLNYLERERTCLEVLSGLAVPRLLKVSSRQLPALRGLPKGSHLAYRYVQGRAIDDAGLTPIELLAYWIFVVEQVSAFRRHQLVYCRIGCRDIIVENKTLTATLVGLDATVLLARSWRPLVSPRASSAAPEAQEHYLLTERSVVYELGMLLAHVLTDTNNASLRSGGLDRARRMLTDMGAAELGLVMADCLAVDPKKRPRNFEDVFRRIKRTKIPEPADALWKKLRAPHARRLAEVGYA